jgi:RNA polymerase sigma-70 factor, ECF subfamily
VKRPLRDRQSTDFERLFRETRSHLLAYLVRRAPTPEEAADLLAETYLIAWRRLEAIPSGDDARLWLYGVARNLLMKSANRRRAGAHLVERLASELRTAQPVQPAGSDERAARVRAALAGLREKDRELLMLAAWEGLTPKQIATVMGTSANIVRVRLHRARTRLGKQLDPIGKDAEPPLRLGVTQHSIEG